MLPGTQTLLPQLHIVCALRVVPCRSAATLVCAAGAQAAAATWAPTCTGHGHPAAAGACAGLPRWSRTLQKALSGAATQAVQTKVTEDPADMRVPCAGKIGDGGNMDKVQVKKLQRQLPQAALVCAGDSLPSGVV